MIFTCFPPQEKCEWFHLREFVDRYNSSRGKAYTLTACLDVEGRSDKEPELLLNAPGETPIVIERKSVVWPREEYFADHRNEHDLHDLFVDRIRSLGDPFTDSVYQLTVNARSLRGKRKRDVERLAEQIADIVLSDHDTAKSPRGIGSREPIPWRFRPLSRGERDESVPETGIGLVVWEEPEPSEPSEIRQRIETAKAGYASEFERSAQAAAEKFVKYSHCQKLLLVQFCGDGSGWLQDEDIVEIIKSAPLPQMIDQVWLACPEWVSDYDHEVTWEHVR